MRALRVASILLTSGVVLAGVVLAEVRAGSDSASVVFAPSPGHAPRKAILEAIASAQQSIDVAQFLFSDDAIAHALLDAKGRGCRVRLLVDAGMAKSVHSSLDRYLAARGIPTKRISGYGVFHHKFAVIDGTTTVTGSMNWSQDVDRWNFENVVTIQDAAIASAYAREFESLFTSGEGGTGSTQDVLFAPSGKARTLEARLAAEFEGAKKEIVVAIYTFTSPDVSYALRRALARGVKVSLLCDGRQWPTSRGAVQPLVAAGAQLKLVRLYGKGILAEKFHDKYAVIDGTTVLTGSYNWTPSQDASGYENLVVLRDPSLAKDFIRNFANVWSSPVAHD